MSQGRSIIDIIQDPAALDAFLRSSAKSSSNNTNNSPRVNTNAHLNHPHTNDQTRLATSNVTNIGNNIYNQNTTNNTNVQITQNTFNINSNPTVSTISQQQTGMVSGELGRVVNQNIGAQTNVNVFLNQTVIQQPSVVSTTTPTTTSNNNQQPMVTISINGTQTLIPITAFTKLLQSKANSNQPNMLSNPPTCQTIPNGGNGSVIPNLPTNPSSGTTTVRIVRPTTNNLPTSSNNNLMTLTSGQRLLSPFASKSQTGNIILQVANNETTTTRPNDKTTNSDLTTQLMHDLQANGSDPEKQIGLIDTYLSRIHSTDKDREFCTRIIRYRETLSQSVEQVRINGQHRQRLLDQSTKLNTLSSSPTVKREPQTTSTPTNQTKTNGTTLIQLPLAKQEELLNAVLKKLRHVNLPDLQAQGILPIELTFEQKLQIQKLDIQIAALPPDKQQQFSRSQRELVPKYLAKNAATGLQTTTTLTVNPRTKILLGAPPNGSSNSINSTSTITSSTNTNTRSLRISSADLIGQQLRKDQAHVLKPDLKSRFSTRGDAIKRLTRYHVLSKPASPICEPQEEECRQFDEAFENESRRLLAATERINESICRINFASDHFNYDTYDRYLLEKLRVDDLREQLEIEKSEFETRKKRAIDVENKPVGFPLSDGLNSNSFNCDLSESTRQTAAAMSDDAYFDLFRTDSFVENGNRTNDETQIAINSIVDFGLNETQENPLENPSSSNYVFDDLDLDNNQQEHNPSRDDETSRAVQNLLGFS